MGYPIQQSTTTQPLTFVLVSSSDHITGLTGKAGSVVVKISKNGATAVTPSGAITEVDAANCPGWYAVAGNATDSNTLGPLILHAKDAASDPWDDLFSVVAYNGQDAVHMGLSALPNAAAGASGGLPLGDASGHVALQAGTGAGQLDFTSGVVKSNLSQLLGGTVPAPNVTGVPLVDLTHVLGTISPATAGSVRADSVTGAVGSVTGAVGSVTGAVGSVAGAVGSVTGNVGGSVASVSGAVGSVTGAVGSVTGNVGGSVVGDVEGKVLGGGVSALSGVGVQADVEQWRASAPNVLIAGKVDANAGSASDPWATALPGSYGAGTAGLIIGGNLNAAVSTRATPAQILATPANLLASDTSGRVTLTPGEHTNIATDAQTGLTAQGYTTTRSGYLDTLNGLVATTVAAIWNALTSGMTTAGSIGLKLKNWVLGSDNKALLSTDAQTGVTIPTVGAVTGAVGSVTGNVGGSVGSVTGAVGSVTGSVGSVAGAVGSVTAGVTVTTNNDKTGYALTSAEETAIANAVLDFTNGIETGLTPRQTMRIMVAALAGKLTGAATTTITIQAADNPATTRIVATVDASGNRSALTLTP